MSVVRHLTRLFQVQLAEAIHIALGVNYNYAEIPIKPHFTKQSETYQTNTYHYTSPIALSLADQLGRSPLEIARVIERVMVELSSDRFSVAVGGEGWLNFRLSDRLIADNLRALYQAIDRNEIVIPIPNLAQNFPGYTYVQYAYARCCALLCLARERELIGDLHNPNWQFLDPAGGLYLRESAEVKLVLCLVAIADEVAQGVKGSILPKLDRDVAIKFSKNLAANFLHFYDECRIVSMDCNLGVARIGLVATTQKVITYLASELIVLAEAL
jgi:arginyl-tRNA synthetase